MPRSARTAAVLIVVVALLTLLPFVGGDYYVYLFALVFINVILAASLRPSLTCGQLNIGHSAFMCIGAYTSALLAKNLGVPFELSLLCGAAPGRRRRAGHRLSIAEAAGRLLRHGHGGLRRGDPPHRLDLGVADPRQCRLERYPQAQHPGHDAGHAERVSTTWRSS